jgi:hypothetical protein
MKSQLASDAELAVSFMIASDVCKSSFSEIFLRPAHNGGPHVGADREILMSTFFFIPKRRKLVMYMKHTCKQ